MYIHKLTQTYLKILGASCQNHAMGFGGMAILANQSHIGKVFVAKKLIENSYQIHAVVVPSQAVLLGLRHGVWCVLILDKIISMSLKNCIHRKHSLPPETLTGLGCWYHWLKRTNTMIVNFRLIAVIQPQHNGRLRALAKVNHFIFLVNHHFDWLIFSWPEKQPPRYIGFAFGR